MKIFTFLDSKFSYVLAEKGLMLNLFVGLWLIQKLMARGKIRGNKNFIQGIILLLDFWARLLHTYQISERKGTW